MVEWRGVALGLALVAFAGTILWNSKRVARFQVLLPFVDERWRWRIIVVWMAFWMLGGFALLFGSLLR